MEFKRLFLMLCLFFSLILSGCGKDKPAPPAPVKEVATNAEISPYDPVQEAQDERTLQRTMEVYDKVVDIISNQDKCKIEFPTNKYANSKLESPSVLNVLSKIAIPALDLEENFYLKKFKSDLDKYEIDSEACLLKLNSDYGEIKSIYLPDTDYAVQSVVNIYYETLQDSINFYENSNEHASNYKEFYKKYLSTIGDVISFSNYFTDIAKFSPGLEAETRRKDFKEINDLNNKINRLRFLIKSEYDTSIVIEKQFIEHMENKYHVTLPAKYHAK